MKNIVMPLTEQLSEETRRQLTSNEVKETLATANGENTAKKNYTAAEMWYSQRNVRSASTMLRRWSVN